MEALAKEDLVFLGVKKLRVAGSSGSVQITLPLPWAESQGLDVGERIAIYQDTAGCLYLMPRRAGV